ncbi:host cell division inhibitory peptide Kil [Escherichia coli]|nr:host cell division inhibitory peptide Kil [Escherichia coli]
MERNHLTAISAAQSKFAIAVFLQDEEMFEQAIIQFAIASGSKINEHFVRSCHDRFSDIRRNSGCCYRNL